MRELTAVITAPRGPMIPAVRARARNLAFVYVGAGPVPSACAPGARGSAELLRRTAALKVSSNRHEKKRNRYLDLN